MEKLISFRIDAEYYGFLNRLARQEHEDKSKVLRNLLSQGRIFLGINEYGSGKVSLEKAAKLAGLSLTEFMDELTKLGIESKIEYEDYIQGLKNLEKVW